MTGASITNEVVIFGRIISDDISLSGRLSMTIDREYYTGPLEFTPKLSEQIINTRDKVVPNDMTINGIPIYEVSNPQGGNTVIIGG